MIRIVIAALLLANTINVRAAFEFSLSSAETIFYGGQLISYQIKDPEASFPTHYKLSVQDSYGKELISNLLYLEVDEYSGSFLIPTGMPSGNYTLHCWNLANPDAKHTQMLSIVNVKSFSKEDVIDELNYKHIEAKQSEIPSINGVVTKQGKPVSGVIVTLQSRGDTNEFMYVLTDAKGEFDFNIPLFGDCELLIATPELDDETIKVQLNNTYPKSSESDNHVPFKLSLDQLDTVVLKETVIEYSNQDLEKDEGEIVFDHIEYDRSYFRDDYKDLYTTTEFIKEVVALKQMRAKKNDTTLRLISFKDNLLFKGEPVFLVDGFMVEGIEDILEVPLDNIESIYVTHDTRINGFYLGRFGVYGAFMVVTKSRNYRSEFGMTQKVVGFDKPQK